MGISQSDLARFSPLHTICRYLAEGEYDQIPEHFIFEYDTTGTYHGIHDHFELHRILNQLSSNHIDYRKMPGNETDQILKYEVKP